MPQQSLEYKNCEIAWMEPPLTSKGWQATVASKDPHMIDLLFRSSKQRGAVIIDGTDRDDLLERTKAFIDNLLGE